MGTSNALGGYGFRLVWGTSECAPADLVDLGEHHTPAVDVRWRLSAVSSDFMVVEPGCAGFGTEGQTGFLVRRPPLSISIDMHRMLPLDGLLHPMMTAPLAVLSRWRGDVTLHAGAFVAAGGAWAVVGAREAGKSTTLAMLADHGVPIVCDDLLAVDGTDVWAGPSCVDLRPDVAERFGAARSLGEIAGRVRHRLSTPASPARLPLRGFIVLDWHDRQSVEATRMMVPALLELLYRQEYMALLGPAAPEKIMRLLGLPAWRLARPRDWASSDDVVQRVLELVATA